MSKPNLKRLRPQIQNIVSSSTTPKGYFYDLRPTFERKIIIIHNVHGIHPTRKIVMRLRMPLWEEMKRVGFFEVSETIKYEDCNNDGNINVLDF